MALHVAKEDFKFNAAHFVVHAGRRERLHGHNYRVALTVEAAGGLPTTDTADAATNEGMLVDFGALKAIMRRQCAALDERFLAAGRSATVALTTSADGRNVELRVAADGDFYSFPAADVVVLPVVAVTVEELARHLLTEFVAAAAPLGLGSVLSAVTVAVGETPGQEARVTARLAPAPAPEPPVT